MWKNGPKECELISASFYLRNKYLHSKTVCTPKPLLFMGLTSPKIENFASKGPIFCQLKKYIKKRIVQLLNTVSQNNFKRCFKPC